jgi:hypothetical protein
MSDRLYSIWYIQTIINYTSWQYKCPIEADQHDEQRIRKQHQGATRGQHKMKKTSTTRTMIRTVCVLDGESGYNANLTFLRLAEWPLVPYPSKILRACRMDPSGTGDCLPCCIALHTRILHPRLQPLLSIPLLAVWMKDHVVCRSLACLIPAPIGVETPRPPVLQIGVCEDSGIDNASSLLIFVAVYVRIREEYGRLIQSVSVLAE